LQLIKASALRRFGPMRKTLTTGDDLFIAAGLAVLWKAIWVLTSALPMWLGPGLDRYASDTLFACLIGVVLVPIAVPWRHVIHRYVMASSEPWRVRAEDAHHRGSRKPHYAQRSAHLLTIALEACHSSTLGTECR
jgi:hypothetical protein